MICRNCGETCPEDARFCPKCSAAILPGGMQPFMPPSGYAPAPAETPVEPKAETPTKPQAKTPARPAVRQREKLPPKLTEMPIETPTLKMPSKPPVKLPTKPPVKLPTKPSVKVPSKPSVKIPAKTPVKTIVKSATGSAVEPPPEPEKKSAKKSAKKLDAHIAPQRADGSAPGRLKRKERFPLPRFLKRFHVEKTVTNAFIFLVSLGALYFIVSALTNINAAVGFSSYARLERLFDMGLRFVIVETKSISTVALNSGPSDTDTGSPYDPGVSHFLIELPDGVVFVTGDASLFLLPQTSRAVFWVRRSDGRFQGMVNRRIESFDRLPSYMDTPDMRQELELLNRISGNVKPLVLRPVNAERFLTVAYAFGVVFAILFAFFGARLIRSGTILVFPRLSRTYRILAKFGDPTHLIRKCEASYGESKKNLEPREHVLANGFVIYPSSSRVFIAPVSELVRAHIRTVSDDTDGPASYEMALFFTRRVRLSYRISDKAEGEGELKWMKRYNPNIKIGFDPSSNRHELF